MLIRTVGYNLPYIDFSVAKTGDVVSGNGGKFLIPSGSMGTLTRTYVGLVRGGMLLRSVNGRTCVSKGYFSGPGMVRG